MPYIKSYQAVLVTAVILILICGAWAVVNKVNNDGRNSTDSGVTMTIQKVTQSSISYTLENPTGKEYGFGGDCGPFLYVYKNESWEYAEPIVDSWTCTALMYTIMPHSEINRTYNYHIWLGELPKGYYKFQKEIYDLSANETIILEQKFSIS